MWDDGLDDIPWSELSAAHGPAVEVPKLLRELAASDEHDPRGALRGELSRWVWARCSVYCSATPVAVRDLIRLLEERPPCAKRVLSVLDGLSPGHNLETLPAGEPLAFRDTPALADLPHATETLAALREGLHCYLAFLTD